MFFKPTEICDTNLNFQLKCAEVFDWQCKNNRVYKIFLDGLDFCGTVADSILNSSDHIPLIPIEVFRDYKSNTLVDSQDLIFRSSGTTGMIRSEHRVPYPELYELSIWNGLSFFYPIQEFVFLGYTPGYNDNPNSSLIWMINYMISSDKTGLSRFLSIGSPISDDLIEEISRQGKRIMLFGAAFGLIDLVENHPIKLPFNSIVMETGGMKTFRKEMSRKDMHHQLAAGFGLSPDDIHSEYGMTELLSQGYSRGSEWFETPPWMKVTIRDPENPARIVPTGEQGLIGVIDLANWATYPFLLTGDRGVQRQDGSFQVLGRWSNYNLRGCNFLLERD
jgi:hypothetical protein